MENLCGRLGPMLDVLMSSSLSLLSNFFPDGNYKKLSGYNWNYNYKTKAINDAKNSTKEAFKPIDLKHVGNISVRGMENYHSQEDQPLQFNYQVLS